jgi:hypothetical protein
LSRLAAKKAERTGRAPEPIFRKEQNRNYSPPHQGKNQLINNVFRQAADRAQSKYRKAAQGLKVFLLLFLQKKKNLFFSEEKNQKTFTFWRRVQGSGIWPAKNRRINGLQSAHGR